MNSFLLAQTTTGLGFFEVLLVALISIGGFLAVFRENKIGWFLCAGAVALFVLDLFGLI